MAGRTRVGGHLTRRELLLLGAAAFSTATSCARGDDPAPRAAPETAVHYASLFEVAGWIETRDLSPVSLTEAILDRIERLDPELRSFAAVTPERALAAARGAEEEIASGNYRGPLHGIPVAVKDLFYTEGVPTTGGLRVRAGFVPTFDATAVARLRQAGAVLLGKLNLSEGAMPGYHAEMDIPVNPWDEDLWPGSSSSGSGVAVAAGLCFGALGSDTGGSITFPAMANGIVGIKPTYGLVSRHGVMPLAPSLDHVGPMARRVADAAAILEAIAGPDPEDATALGAPAPDLLGGLDRGVDGVRIGYDREYASEGVDPALVAAIEAALTRLEGMGAEIVDVDVPDFSEELVDAWFTLCSYEAARIHADTYPARADEYGPYYSDFLDQGRGVSEPAYVEAGAMRAAFSERFETTLAEVDAVACPAGGVPFTIPRDILYGDMASLEPVMPNIQFHFTAPANFAGTPAIALPCGVSVRGVPYTIQLLGRRLAEPALCRIAHAYEQSTDWHTLRPGI